MKNRIIFALVVLGVFAFSALLGYKGPDALKSRSEKQEQGKFVAGAVPKKQLDDFSAQFNGVETAKQPMTFPDSSLIDGEERAVRLKDFAGMPVLVNLWATWCGPCVVELPSLDKFARYYDGRLKVLAVSVDEGKSVQQLKSFLADRGVASLGAVMDKDGGIIKNLSLRGIPTSFLIGRDGQILYRFEGDADWSSESTRAFFDVFLLQNR